MGILYLIGCVACLALGGYLSIRQITILMKKQRNEVGFNLPEFIAGVVFFIIGIIILVKYL